MSFGGISSEIGILKDLIIIMAVALGTIYLAKKIRLPAIVGFLAAGLIIGPTSFSLIKEVHQIEILAEIGVILLLFTIGLEFSLNHLLQIKKYLLLEGGLQVFLTTGLVVLSAIAFHLPLRQAIFFGFLISLSSTAMIMKLYAERGEVNAPHGNAAVGILLFQDLCIVPMMLLLPALGGQGGKAVFPFLLIMAKSVLAVGGIVLMARILFPWIMKKMVATRIREAFTLTIILFCLGTAWTASLLGLSLALGAFIAGLIISESEFSHQAISEILPMADSFSGLFFISVGMLLDLRFVTCHLWKVILLGALILTVKGVILFLVTSITRRNIRLAILISFALAQIGEFSFILAQSGLRFALINQDIYQLFLASSIMSMMVTPFLINCAPRIALGVQTLLGRWLPEEKPSLEPRIPPEGHTLIIGFGLNGKNLARVLRESGLAYQIIDLNAENVRQGKKQGHPIMFGDATRKEILSQVAVDKAKIAVVAISDPAGSRRIVWQIKSMNPAIYLIIRTRLVSEVEELYRMGADQVIPEEFETSVEIFSHVLHRYRIPRNIINLQVNIIRNSGYRMLRSLSPTSERLDDIQKIIALAVTESYLVTPDSPVIGQTLKDIQLRSKTGVTVMGIIRGNTSLTNPAPTIRIQAEDILVMFGSHEQLDHAFTLLSRHLPNSGSY